MSDKGSILVLDDSAVTREQIAGRLSTEGYAVRGTDTVADATKLLAGVEVVIVDYHLGSTDGFTALKTLKPAAATAAPTCKFYLYTGDKAIALQARAQGFEGAFTVKGDLEALVRQLSMAMRAARMAAKIKKP